LGVGGDASYGGPGGAGTLNITGGTLTSGGMWAGHGGTGTINLSGGTLNIGGQHMLYGWNYSSYLNVSGGTLNMTGSGSIFRFGNSGQSFMNITTNGLANLSGLGIDLLANSQISVAGGTLNLTNTTETNSIVNVTAGAQMLVNNGGIVNLLAGTQTIGMIGDTNLVEGFYLGHGGSTGTLNISGGTWQQNTYMRLGVFANGNGIVNQTGGTFEIGGALEAWGSSPSAYNLSGGTFRVMTNGVQINSYSGGAMTFNITGSSGNVTIDTPFNFTAPNTSVFNNTNATLTKTGAGTLTMAGQLDIRNGALSMSDGTIETSSGTYIGTAGGTASGTMSGGTLKNGYLAGANFSVGYNGGTGTFTQSGGANDVGSLANVVIGWDSGSTGTYTLNGGSYSATNNTYIGLAGGTGTVNVNGGSFAAYDLLVGGNGAASGTLNLNGGTLSVANAFYVNSNGTLNLNSGGSLPAVNIGLGGGGALNFNGGTGNASLNIFAGGGAGGTVDVKGQTLAAGNWGNLIVSGGGAVLKNSSATAASIANGNTIWIWDGGQNLTIDASGGAIQIDSWITSSGQTTPTGIIKTGTNSLVLTYAGNDYTGTTAINAGRILITHGNALGATNGGTVVASGAQLMLSNVVVGNEALTISGTGLPGGSSIAGALRSLGTNTWGGKVTLGANATIFGGSGTSLTLDVASGDAVDLSSHTLTVDGAGASRINDAIVGTGGMIKAGSGTTTLAAANIYSGATDIQAGRLTLSGNGRLGSGAITISNASTGTLELAVTGTNVMANNISGAGALLSSAGETRFTGAVTTTGGLTVSGSTVRIGNGGTSGSFSGNTTLSNNTAQLVFDRSNAYAHSGTISGSGSVTKSGAGTTTLTGNNSFSGTTTVEQGKLVVNGSLSSSAVTVASGATLGGNATVGSLTINGVLAPGNSAGTTTSLGNTAWNQGGVYDWEIFNLNGPAGTGWDLLSVSGGTLNLTGITSAGGFTINMITLQNNNNTQGALTGFTNTATYTNWMIASAATITGFNSSLFTLNNSLFVGATGTFAIEQRSIDGGQGLFVTYSGGGSEPIPEPGTWAAAALLALAAGYVRRRRNRASGATKC
jgi:autotransporter-associated beta strand protein